MKRLIYLADIDDSSGAVRLIYTKKLADLVGDTCKSRLSRLISQMLADLILVYYSSLFRHPQRVISQLFHVDLPHTERITPVQPLRSINTWLICLEQSTDLADQPIVLAYLMMADLELFSPWVIYTKKKLADLCQDLADQPSVG